MTTKKYRSMGKERNILDKLEEILIENVRSLFKQAGKDISYDGARNIIAKIGSRIMFTQGAGFDKEVIDEILLGKSPNL